MKTRYTCMRCGQPFAADLDLAGLRVKCLMCGQVQQIPEAQPPPAVAPSAYELSAPPVVRPSAPVVAFEPAPSRSVTRSREKKSARSGWQKWVRPWAVETSRVHGLGTCLVILSVADLLMTFALLRRSPAFFESNPIAQWFLAKWDMTGMVAFKFSLIGGAILASEIIERKRPGWGRLVLFIGCLGAAYAVIHGARLYMGNNDVPLAAELD